MWSLIRRTWVRRPYLTWGPVAAEMRRLTDAARVAMCEVRITRAIMSAMRGEG